MFVNEDLNNSKSTNIKLNFPLYYSPYIHKKKSIGNLYTEPRKIPMEKGTSNSRNKIKQKMSNYSINSNIKGDQSSISKSLKIIREKNKKGRNMHQSYAKFNSKLYLKKNAIPSLSSFHDINSPLIKNSNTNIIKTNANSKSKNKDNNSSGSKSKNKNQNNKNIKLIFGKNSNNNLNNNKRNISVSNNKNINININSQSYGNININQNYQSHDINTPNNNNNLLKKSGGSATELFRNNFIKKSNTNKNIPEMDNIKDQIGYIFSTNGSANKVFLSPQNSKGQKIIFLKNEKNKKEPKDKSRKNSKNNSSAKDSKKKALTQKNEKNLDLDDINMNLDEKNKSVQYLLRNTYNNVKIYPTTVLNNKIIYQEEKKEKISYSVNNSVNTSITHSSIDKKSTDIKIKTNKEILTDNNKNKFNSVEEVHFMLIKTIHNARNIVFQMDKSNK